MPNSVLDAGDVESLAAHIHAQTDTHTHSLFLQFPEVINGI